MAGVEILFEDRCRHPDQFRRRSHRVYGGGVVLEPLRADGVESGKQQVDDRPEVVEDQSLVAAGSTGDGPGTRASETVDLERLDGRVDKSPPGGDRPAATTSIGLNGADRTGLGYRTTP